VCDVGCGVDSDNVGMARLHTCLVTGGYRTLLSPLRKHGSQLGGRGSAPALLRMAITSNTSDILGGGKGLPPSPFPAQIPKVPHDLRR
jgi:hypothetical protein